MGGKVEELKKGGWEGGVSELGGKLMLFSFLEDKYKNVIRKRKYFVLKVGGRLSEIICKMMS